MHADQDDQPPARCRPPSEQYGEVGLRDILAWARAVGACGAVMWSIDRRGEPDDGAGRD